MIRKGSKGEEVLLWQNFLISRQYKIKADSDFGADTDRATRDFQKKNGLDADGIVGEKTYEAKARLSGGKIPAKPVVTAGDSFPALKNVHPKLAEGVREIIALAKADGYTLTVTQGLRTFAEQDKLFLKRPRVTRARGGQSNHNYGLSADLAFVVNGKIDWTDSLYLKIGKWAKQAGLAWGGNWTSFRDLPHVELPGLPNWRKLLETFKAGGGVKAVWEKYVP